MSLVFIYKNDLVADKRMLLEKPYAESQTIMINKLFRAKDNTFAFGSAGVSLSEKEKSILGEIIAQALQGFEQGHSISNLKNEEWFEARNDLSLYVMTHDSTFYMTKSPTSERRYLMRIHANYPIGGGTGFQTANIALLEGVNAADVVPLVADILYSVSTEYDHITRQSLKEMPTC